MTIKELRISTGLSQSKFANKFGIPISNLQDWEQEIHKPPAYLPSLLAKLLEYENLKNIKTTNNNSFEDIISNLRSIEAIGSTFGNFTNAIADEIEELIKKYYDVGK